MAPRDLLPEVRRLLSENKGDRVIAETLDITRHEARKLIREVELANAKQVASVPATMPEILSNDADAWALLINGAFRRSYESTIEVGRLLIAAKEKLAPHGTWLPMLETKLDFSPDTAQRLMAIARDDRLTNTAHARFLPRSYTTLAELTKLSDEQFAHGIEANIISPEMERRDVDLLRPRARASSDGSGLKQAAGTDDLPAGHDSAPPEGDEYRSMTSAGQPSSESGPPSSSDGSVGRKDAGDAAGPSEAEFVEVARVTVGAPAAAMPSGGLAIAHQRIEPTDGLDFFPTPPWATRALFEHVLAHLQRKLHCQYQVAWEPACGEGHMAEVLKEYFRVVHASDKGEYAYNKDMADFLHPDCKGSDKVDWIITNPPFNDSADFVLKALKLAGTGVAMFVRLTWLESVGRYERIFRDQPPTQLAIFTERVPLHKGRWEADGVTMTAYIWLVWIKGAEPRAPFWIPPGCREALTKPDDAKRFGKIAIEGEVA